MTTYNTGNALGSTAVKDLYDNAENLDVAVNSTALTWLDRGPSGIKRTRKTWAGIEADARASLLQQGYIYTTPVNYAAGITISLPNQVFNKDGEYYKPSPNLTLPYVTTGTWASEQANFRSVGDATLRSALAQPNGASLVGGSIQSATSIAALRSLPTSGNSKYARTAGYYLPGDGGHGDYVASTVGGQVEDGCTVIAATDGGFWLLQHGGVINILQAGAKTDKTWDCTAAINAAIKAVGNSFFAARGGKVVIPNSWFNFTGTLLIDKPFVTIEGTSLQGPMLRSLTNNAPAVRSTANFTALANLEITYATTPEAGASGVEIAGSNFNAHGVIVSNAWDGWWFRGGSAHILDNVRAYDCMSTGFRFHADSGFMNDVILTNWFAITNDQTRFALGQFRVVGRLEALMLGKGDGIGGHAAFTCDALGSAGLRYSTFESCFWDSTDTGAIFNAAHYNKFVNCWASNGRGTGGNGLSFINCTHFSVTNGQLFNSGAAGLFASGCSDFSVIGTDFSTNSVDVSGGASGLYVVNSVRFTLGQNTGDGTQQFYGALVDNCSDFNAIGNVFGANKSGSIMFGSTCANFTNSANRGFVARKADIASLPAGATSLVVNHGLSRLPSLSGIRVTPNGAMAAPLYVSAVTATTFTVNTATSNSASTPFSWEASAELVG
jgi:hypothetical protein